MMEYVSVYIPREDKKHGSLIFYDLKTEKAITLKNTLYCKMFTLNFYMLYIIVTTHILGTAENELKTSIRAVE